MRWRLLICVLFLITFISCIPSIDSGTESKSDQLIQQVQNEGVLFEELLLNAQTDIAGIKYPNDVSLSMIIPDGWLFETLVPDVGNKIESVLAIPAPKGIKTGLTVEKSTEGWVYYRRTTYLNPKTNIYIVSIMPPPRYASLQGTPSDFKDYPKRIQVDYLKSYKVVVSPYYIPDNVTHGLYQIDGPLPFRDGGNNYRLSQIVNQMIDANPYLEKPSPVGTSITEFMETGSRLWAQVGLIREDIDNVLDFVNRMEKTYFIPNSWSWDNKDKLAEYRDSMNAISDSLSKLETCLHEVNDWNFSNLEKCRTLSDGLE